MKTSPPSRNPSQRLLIQILTNRRWVCILKHTPEVFEGNKCETISIRLTANP